MGLAEYRRKRDFTRTPEPEGRAGQARGAGLRFVVQKHDASHLHYDFRLEWGGVLRSWAVPKGPSLDPSRKRLAVQVEDHPVSYRDFEGTIPEGAYGGGTVMVWDRGAWEPLDDDPAAALDAGRLRFALHGEKLRGEWRLIRMAGASAKPRWMLVKADDAHARRGAAGEVTALAPESVKTGRDLDAIADAAPSKSKTKNATERKREPAKSRAAPALSPRLTHPERVYFPEAGVTKAELAAYYAAHADAILRWTSGRPITLVRCPEGVDGERFVQRHVPRAEAVGLETISVRHEGRTERFVTVTTPEGLAGLAQIGVLELHAWGSREGDPLSPEVMVLDLDPAEDVPWSRVAALAHALREDLAARGLTAFAKLTGGKGVHLCVPLAEGLTWEALTDASRALTRELVALHPDALTAESSLERRAGRVFVDYMRNAYAASTVVPFSPRARRGAPVALPVSWDDVRASLAPDAVSIRTIDTWARERPDDPWAGFDAARSRLGRATSGSRARRGAVSATQTADPARARRASHPPGGIR